MIRQPANTPNSKPASWLAFTICPPCRMLCTLSIKSWMVTTKSTLYLITRNKDSTWENPYGLRSVTGRYNSGTSTRNGPIIIKSVTSNTQSISIAWEWLIYAITPSATTKSTLPIKDRFIILFSSFILLAAFISIITGKSSLAARTFFRSSIFFPPISGCPKAHQVYLFSLKNHIKNRPARRTGLNCYTAIMHSHNFMNQSKSQTYAPQFPASGFIHTKEWFKHALP